MSDVTLTLPTQLSLDLPGIKFVIIAYLLTGLMVYYSYNYYEKKYGVPESRRVNKLSTMVATIIFNPLIVWWTIEIAVKTESLLEDDERIQESVEDFIWGDEE